MLVYPERPKSGRQYHGAFVIFACSRSLNRETRCEQFSAVRVQGAGLRHSALKPQAALSLCRLIEQSSLGLVFGQRHEARIYRLTSDAY